jgi:hypothetical protein
MKLSGNYCGCIGSLIMLIGITTGGSAVQPGSEGTSSASRGPSGDAGAKKWSSPSSASGAKSWNPFKPITASATKASEQTVNMEESGSAEKKEDIVVIEKTSEKTGSASGGDKASEKEKSEKVEKIVSSVKEEKVEDLEELIEKIKNIINEKNKK